MNYTVLSRRRSLLNVPLVVLVVIMDLFRAFLWLAPFQPKRCLIVRNAAPQFFDGVTSSTSGGEVSVRIQRSGGLCRFVRDVFHVVLGVAIFLESILLNTYLAVVIALMCLVQNGIDRMSLTISATLCLLKVVHKTFTIVGLDSWSHALWRRHCSVEQLPPTRLLYDYISKWKYSIATVPDGKEVTKTRGVTVDVVKHNHLLGFPSSSSIIRDPELCLSASNFRQSALQEYSTCVKKAAKRRSKKSEQNSRTRTTRSYEKSTAIVDPKIMPSYLESRGDFNNTSQGEQSPVPSKPKLRKKRSKRKVRRTQSRKAQLYDVSVHSTESSDFNTECSADSMRQFSTTQDTIGRLVEDRHGIARDDPFLVDTAQGNSLIQWVKDGTGLVEKEDVMEETRICPAHCSADNVDEQANHRSSYCGFEAPTTSLRDDLIDLSVSSAGVDDDDGTTDLTRNANKTSDASVVLPSLSCCGSDTNLLVESQDKELAEMLLDLLETVGSQQPKWENRRAFWNPPQPLPSKFAELTFGTLEDNEVSKYFKARDDDASDRVTPTMPPSFLAPPALDGYTLARSPTVVPNDNNASGFNSSVSGCRISSTAQFNPLTPSVESTRIPKTHSHNRTDFPAPPRFPPPLLGSNNRNSMASSPVLSCRTSIAISSNNRSFTWS